jgi:DNA-binding transcriptional ArsR family regulator
MARAAATSDVYNAIAEPRRRAIFEMVCEEERGVSDVVARLGIDQPSVSKHLRVLREVNLVTVRRDGRRRLYSANAEALRPVHTWVGGFEHFWNQQLDAIQARAETKNQSASQHPAGEKRRTK